MMNPVLSKIISVAAFFVFLYCAAETILMAVGMVEYSGSALTSNLIMIAIMIYAFIKQKTLF
jgi:hypothetical protein